MVASLACLSGLFDSFRNLSEYWKSNPRKFCDFCKCWIADNRPSVDFHERGKKHKENVEKRLDVIAKKGKEDYKNKQKEDDYMKAMEKAALAAYKKDLAVNPDMTGNEITEMARASNATIIIGSEQNFDKLGEKKTPKEKLNWHEAKSPDGSSYYWHIVTSESCWEPPKEGFVSLNEQKKMENKKLQKQKSDNTPKSDKPFHKPKSKSDQPRKKSFQPKPKPLPPVTYGPEPKGQPYGTWKTALEPVSNVDLQLPALPEEETYCVPEVVIKKPKITFAEKQVTLSADIKNNSNPVFFKKRKTGDEQKRNVRGRVAD